MYISSIFYLLQPLDSGHAGASSRRIFSWMDRPQPGTYFIRLFSQRAKLCGCKQTSIICEKWQGGNAGTKTCLKETCCLSCMMWLSLAAMVDLVFIWSNVRCWLLFISLALWMKRRSNPDLNTTQELRSNGFKLRTLSFCVTALSSYHLVESLSSLLTFIIDLDHQSL